MSERESRSHRLMWIMSGIMLAVSIFVIYLTHRAVPFMMDDLWYSTMLSNDTPITSFSDIIQSQIWHYHNWGGRSMTHGILQLTLLAGEAAADVLNVIVTLLLAGIICMVSENHKFPAFLAAFAMALGLNANWRMSMFWQSGAANYLYITVFVLAFAHCYLRELPGEHLMRSSLPGIAVWVIPLGILTGWSNENMGPAMWVLSAAVIGLAIKDKSGVKPWMVLGNLACLAGSVMCIAAPGNFVRVRQSGEEQYGTMWKIFLRSYGECRAALEYLFPTLLVLGFLWMLNCCVLKQALGMREKLLLFCALLSWGAFFLSPHYPDRASFGTMALCICVILSLTEKILRRRGELAWPLWGGMAVIWLRGMYFCGEYLALTWGWIK